MTAPPWPIVLMSDDEVAALGRDPDAGFGALETRRGLLPLIALDVDARVAGTSASIEVAQTFVNTTTEALEATYIFPLPDRSAVHRFRMEVAGRVVEGVVDERGAAREQYDQAIAAGHRAAITEEERAGVFTLRVGNLMPGEVATVRLSLVGPLAVDDGEVTFRFPLVVAPRYIPGTILGGDPAGLGTSPDTYLVPDASRISPPVLLAGCPNPVRLGLRVMLEDHAVQGVTASLHTVTTSLRDAHVVEVRPGERLDRDFVLRWRIDGAALRSSLACVDDADGRAGTFALTLVPPSTTTIAAKPRDVVVVIDRSGSMAGWKMVAARRAAARMIDSLTSRDRFCAITFDNVCELHPEPNLVDATDRNRFRAVLALAQVAARGGTELAEPLRRAAGMLAGGTDDRERVIVLLTDGQVGNEDQLLRELVPHLRNVRMFTLGIDQAVNAAFLRRLAAAGGGLCELVESEDRLDAVMSKVHRRIGAPIATDLGVRGLGLAVEVGSLAPTKLPDVYAGAPVTILGRYHGSAPKDARVELTATSLGEATCTVIARHAAADLDSARPTPWLAASWARAAIRDLEDRYAIGERGELEPKIVAVSKRFGVLSRFTAYLAIDRSEVVNVGGHGRQVIQQVEHPAGWADAAATPRGRAEGGAAYASPVMRSIRPSPAAAPRGPSAFAASAAPPSAPRAADSAFGGSAAPAAPRGPSAFAGSAAPPSAPRAADSAPDLRSPSPVMASAEARAGIPAAPPRQPPPPPPAALGLGQAYLASLGVLARELAAHGAGTPDPSAIRVLRQRLLEWIEDVRSVGGFVELAAAVEAQVDRLNAALVRGPAGLGPEVVAISISLGELAAGKPPPAPKPGARVAFWK